MIVITMAMMKIMAVMAMEMMTIMMTLTVWLRVMVTVSVSIYNKLNSILHRFIQCAAQFCIGTVKHYNLCCLFKIW